MKTLKEKNKIDVSHFDFRFVNLSALIIKVTNKCNMECKYCYEDISKKGDILPIETFKKIAEKTVISSINNKITFIFHGGEPTLVPISWYTEAISFCNSLGQLCGKNVKYGLQTNLISLTNNKLQDLINLGINISASIDANNDFRIPDRGFSNKAIETYFRAKSLQLNINILSTINKSNYDSFGRFIDFLKIELGVKSFKANVAYPVGVGKFTECITPSEIFQAKRDIVDRMISEKGQGVNEINTLKQIRKYLGQTDSCQIELCDKQTCGAGKSVLGFNHKGDILPCGRFTWNDSTYYLGSIYEHVDVSQQNYEASLSNFQTQNSENWIDCKKCPAKSICNFGCQAFINRSSKKINIECASTKMLFEYFTEKKDYIKIIYENNKNRLETGYSDYSDYSDSY